ncbi:gliding motility-associated C-terminal domain-containing protein, partial [Fulvivirga lutimaris]|uniref:gliding motility-associated C-terminal domain-containing protein n=1 Tax=Fulvivirga lutimaris TaxID=1819566 RepID=UPI0012BC6952
VSETTDVLVNPLPVPTITGPVALCFNAEDFYTTEDLQSNYTWNVTGGTITVGGSGRTIAVQWDSPTGPYEVSVNYTDANGCTATTPTVLPVTINNPVITVPATTTDICEPSGTVDLTTIVSANPAGGTFTFNGTGVTGNNFDPTGLSGAINIDVDYVQGGCSAATEVLALNVVTASTITVLADPVDACEADGNVDLTAFVSASPAGGSFTFTGPGVTGSDFNPTGLSGSTVNVLVDYDIAGSCAATQVDFDINVVNAATINVLAASTSICESAGSFDLTTLVEGSPIGGDFTFTGTGVSGTNFEPLGLAGNTINIDVDYTTAGGGCVAITASVEMVVTSDPVITVPVVNEVVCEDGGTIDLSTLVSANPAGGTFAFSGAGVAAGTSNFDPTGLAGNTETITVDYSFGGCNAATETFDIDIIATPVISVTPSDICETGGVIDLTTLVSASTGGGTFVFNGTGVTGSNFNPLGQSGNIDILVDYSLGGCDAVQETLSLNIVTSSVITTPATAVDICEGGGPINLTTLVSAAPAGGTFSFAGTAGVTGSDFDPIGLAGTTQTITVNYDFGGTCAATPVDFDINVVGTPSLATVDADVCANGTIDLDDVATTFTVSPSGGTFAFDTPSAGTIDPGNIYNAAGLTAVDGPVSVNVTYTVAGCTDALGTLNINILNSPTLALNATPEVCAEGTFDLTTLIAGFTVNPGGGTITFGNPSAGNIDGSDVFDAAGLTSADSPVTIDVTYAIGGCGNVIEQLQVTILDLPTLSVVNSSVCADETLDLNTLIAGFTTNPAGGTFTFNNPSAGSINGSNVFDATGLTTADSPVQIDVTYTVSGCSVLEVLEIVIDGTTSVAPTVDGSTLYCVNETIIDDLTVAGGVDVKWYSDAALTNEIASGNIFDPVTDFDTWSTASVATFSVFVTETTGCTESTSTQVDINIVDTTPPPTGDANQSFCSGATPTIDDLVTNEPNITWYTTASGTTTVPAGEPLTDATTYHAAQTLGSCGESTQRLAVTVTLFTETPAPTGSPFQTFCDGSGDTVDDIQVSGAGAIQWFDASSGGTPYNGSDLLVDGTYFAEQTIAGCGISPTRLAVTVSLVTETPAPTGSTGQTFCPVTNATLANINVFGTDIQWYASLGSTSKLPITTSLVNGATYFATQTIPGCGESTQRLAVTATILAADDPLCSGGGGGGGPGGPICTDIASLSVTDVINPDCGLENGSLTISVEFNTDPGNIIYGLKYFDADLADSVFTTQLNDSVFNTLAALNYRYFVTAGVDTCFLDFNLAPRTSVSADADFVQQNVSCFDANDGSIEISGLTGSADGNYFYSINGGDWVELNNLRIPNLNDPNGLSVGNNLVEIGREVDDPCPFRIENILLNSDTPEIKIDVAATEVSTCDSSDGSISVTASGGSGGGFTFAFAVSGTAVNSGQFSSSPTQGSLAANDYDVYVRDAGGCTSVQTIEVRSPGQIEIDEFNSFAQQASCDAPSSGSVVMRLANLGAVSPPFNLSIATTDDPDNPIHVDEQGWNGDTRIFPRTGDGLLSGDYIATISSNTEGICAGTFEFTVTGGPIPVSFDYELQQSCFGATKEYVNELLLTDITGEAGVDYVLTVFNDQQQVVDMLTLTLQIGNQIRVTNRSFLQTPDRTFRLRLGQSQNACPDNIFFDHPSSLEIPEVVAPLSVEVGNLTSSLPERSTGSFDIISITGGVSPFNAVLEGDVPGFGGLGPDEVPFDAFEGRFTLDYDGLGVGDYDLFVMDALGCEIELDIEIPRDSSLFIPNVITPNGDGINDYFVIRNLDISSTDKGANLIITSRWGKQIYSSDNYTNENPWGGDEAAEGLYFYKLEAGGEVYTGWLEVIFGGSP